MNGEGAFRLPERKLLSIEDILVARPQRPIATTRGRGWTGITVDLHRPYYDCAESYPGLDHHLINYRPSGSSRLIQRRAGAVHDSVITTGVVYIMPAGYESSWEGDSGLSARLRVPMSLVASAAEQVGIHAAAQFEVRNVFEARDPFVEHLAIVILDELNQPPHPAQALIVDSVSVALAAHLLRRYNAYELVEQEQPHTFGHREIARLIEYIEDNLDRTITLEELAAIVRISRYHFSRLFKRSTGTTAIGFVERCRVRRAQSPIADTDLPIAEIAQMIGFADQSHFTRRFHRHVGCTPAVFARQHGRRRPGKRKAGS